MTLDAHPSDHLLFSSQFERFLRGRTGSTERGAQTIGTSVSDDAVALAERAAEGDLWVQGRRGEVGREDERDRNGEGRGGKRKEEEGEKAGEKRTRSKQPIPVMALSAKYMTMSVPQL